MNCDEFERRMYQLLDERLAIDSDRKLRRHAERCESCRVQMHAWVQVAKIIPRGDLVLGTPTRRLPESGTTDLRPSPVTKRFSRMLRTLSGLAATLLIAVTAFWYAPDPGAIVVDSDRGEVDSVDSDDRRMILAQTDDLDPALWWQSVQDRDWVGQTMPAVQSLKDGVAPIGRSLMRAVTILTTGGHDQTS